MVTCVPSSASSEFESDDDEANFASLLAVGEEAETPPPAPPADT